MSFIQIIRSSPKPFLIFGIKIFLRRGVVGPTPKTQAGGPPIIAYSRLLLQYIRNYPLYPETVSFISDLKALHALVTRVTPDMEMLNSNMTSNIQSDAATSSKH
jgi:hypothetical protein